MTAVQPDAAELAALREAVRDLVRGAGDTAPARARLDSAPGFDAQLWKRLGTDMGLAGLGLPEQLGGVGGGLAELTTVAEELGRSLLPVPFLSSTVLAGQVLAGCGSPLVQDVAAGTVAAFAGTDADGCWRPSAVGVRAVDDRLTGSVDFVLDGVAAQHLVVAADDGDLYLVTTNSTDEAGLHRQELTTLDPTRAQARVSFAGTPAQRLTSGGTGVAVVNAAVDVTLVVLAAEQIGGAAACLDSAVEYAKVRTQFGRPIGSFQAIKHKLADLLILVEMGRSAIDRALSATGPELTEAAAVAAAWCAEAFVTAAAENVHVNGGTGFTWEHDAHLYVRRARADAALLGDAAFHRERLATLLAW